MAEIIYLREIQQERRRVRVTQRQSLERAVAILIDNLAAVAEQLREAPPAEQSELLDRVEKLTAMIRYGRRMLGEEPEPRTSATK
jgi:hypothetical protein